MWIMFIQSDTAQQASSITVRDDIKYKKRGGEKNVITAILAIYQKSEFSLSITTPRRDVHFGEHIELAVSHFAFFLEG